MLIRNSKFPIFGIEKFEKQKVVGNHEILYNIIDDENHIEKPHIHDFFIIVLFEKATGNHEIDFVNHKISNKEIHLLFPGQVHKWHINDNSKGYQLMIKQVFYEHFLTHLRFSTINYINNPVISLEESTFNQLKYEFDEIKNEIQCENSLQELIYARAAIIGSIISKAAEKLFISTKIHQSNPKLNSFTKLIDLHFKVEKTVSFYASHLNITSNYLNIICKKNIQLSATQLIQERVIFEAKRLLLSTNLNIKEIAYTLGFADHAYFSNFFKNQTGITPTQFREK